MSEDEKRGWAEWIAETCLRFGAAVPTAYQVAGLFVEAIEIGEARRA